ncbi:MAG TPA: class I adenylate-forming enzyme family protein [Rhizomicrobium sp.]
MFHLLDSLAFHAATRPEQLAIATPRARLNYRQLYDASVSAALRVAQLGVERGQTVGIYAVNPALQYVLAAGANRIGAVICVLPQEESLLEAALAQVKPDVLLQDRPVPGAISKMIDVDLTWLEGRGSPKELPPPPFSLMQMGAVCMITMSTGTTGRSKPIGYSVAQFMQRLPWRTFSALATQTGEKTLLLNALPTSYGFITMFGMLWGGDTAYMGWAGEPALQLIEAEKINRVMASTPLIIQLARAFEENPKDCSSLRQIFAAGDTLPERFSRLIATKMCPNLVIAYGANEAGMVSTVTAEQANFDPQCVGYVYPWCQVEIVDEDDNVLPPGMTGVLRIGGASIIQGYLSQDDGTESRFRNGWFYPGDTGYFRQDGALFVTGRLGAAAEPVTANVQAINDVASAHPAVAEAAAFVVRNMAGANEIWLAVVGRDGFDLAVLREYCAKLGADAPQRYLVLPSLPRNESGKVMRWRLVELSQTQNRTP